MICVDLSDVGLAQPDKMLFSRVDVTISKGDRVAVVGVNGSGKTTLLRIMTGALTPDSGDVRFGRGARIVSLEQDPVLPEGRVSDVLGDGWEVQAAATTLGVLPLFDRRTDQLSGGQAKRVALAKVLVDDQQGAFDMVVLDEPTNHLDLEAIEWLESRLVTMRSALVLVTHDRHVLDRLTTAVGPSRIIELDNGQSYTHQAAAGSSAYATYLHARAERIEREAAEESTRKILARKELAWLRRGAPARSTKPKAPSCGALPTSSQAAPQPPACVGTTLSWEPEHLVLAIRSLSSSASRNGLKRRPSLRKSTFSSSPEPGLRLSVRTGRVRPRCLTLSQGGPHLLRARSSEGRPLWPATPISTRLRSTQTPLSARWVAGPYREPDHEDKALLEKFWFDSTAQYAPTRMLSGGERRRLQLVMVLATKPNLLILDEPTNDLDLDTLRSLESFLDDWPGALVTSSHDRAFLDRVADHVLVIDEDGTMRRVPGGVSGWLAKRSTGRTERPVGPGEKGRCIEGWTCHDGSVHSLR